MLVKLLAIVSNSTLIFYIFSRSNTQYVFPPVNFLTVCNFLDGPFLSPGNFFLKKKTVRTESCLWYLGCVNEWKAYHNQKRVINMLWNSALASHKRIPFCCDIQDRFCFQWNVRSFDWRERIFYWLNSKMHNLWLCRGKGKNTVSVIIVT